MANSQGLAALVANTNPSAPSVPSATGLQRQTLNSGLGSNSGLSASTIFPGIESVVPKSTPTSFGIPQSILDTLGTLTPNESIVPVFDGGVTMPSRFSVGDNAVTTVQRENSPEEFNGHSTSYLDQLGEHESRNNYEAYNEGSKAYGKYQFLPGTEKEYMTKLNLTQKEARTPIGQERMIRAFTEDNRKAIIRHGYEPTALNQWIYHNQGATGGRRILENQNVNLKNIKSNIPKGEIATRDNYLKYWSDKFV